MKLQLFAFLAMVALAVAQGVTDKIAPDGDAPAGCEANTDSKFEITIVPLKTKAKKDLAIEVCRPAAWPCSTFLCGRVA
jgi:hypothetical protein